MSNHLSAAVILLVTQLILACTPSQEEEAPELHIVPVDATTTQDLEVVFEFGQQNHRWEYLWFRGEAGDSELLRVKGIDSNTVPASMTTRGDTWQVAVVSQNTGLQTVSGTAQIQIANSPPVLEVEISSINPTTLEPVTAVVVPFDADNDEVVTEITWRRTEDGLSLSHETLSAELTQSGDHWVVTVTGRDGDSPEDGEAEEVTAELTVVNSRPVIESVEISEGPLYDNELITVTINSNDADIEDNLTHLIEWVVDGAVVLTNSPILSGDYFDKNQEVYAAVRVSDGVSTSHVTPSPTRTISNSPPILETTENTPGALRAGSSADCSSTSLLYDLSDNDRDPVSTEIRWMVNGNPVDQTSARLASTYFDKGDTVDCYVSPHDGEEAGLEVHIPFGEVLNTPPVLDFVSFTPPDPTTDTNISAVTGTVTDPDPQDQATFLYTWSKNGVDIQSLANPILSSSLFEKGDIIGITVTPNDGEDGTPASNSVTVQNSPPVVDSVTLLNFQYESIKTNDTAVARHTASDADGEFLWYFYDWSVNGVLLLQGTSNLLDSSNFEKDDLIEVIVRPHDGTEYGLTKAQGVTVANSPPTAPALFLDSTFLDLNQTDPYLALPNDLYCMVIVDSQDADNDPLTYAFEWERDGVVYLGGFVNNSATTSLITVTDIHPQEEWTCIATPSDPDEPGEPGEKNSTIPVPCGSLYMTDTDYAYTSTFPVIQGEATAEFWFKTYDLSSSTDSQELMAVDGGVWTVDFCESGYTISTLGSSFGGTCTSYLSADTWHHLAVRVDTNSAISVFLDGAALSLRDGPGTVALNGGSSVTLGYSLKGSLGEIRIWDRGLTDIELADSMVTWPRPLDEPDLAAWWTFFLGVNSNICTAADWTGHGHNAYVVGGGWGFNDLECPSYP